MYFPELLVPPTLRFLKYLAVIDPINRSHMDLGLQKEKWKYLGQSLDHIVKEEELVRLLNTELPAYQRLEEAEEGKEVDDWWSEVAEVTLGGERQFPILSRFTTAHCTLHTATANIFTLTNAYPLQVGPRPLHSV